MDGEVIHSPLFPEIDNAISSDADKSNAEPQESQRDSELGKRKDRLVGGASVPSSADQSFDISGVVTDKKRSKTVLPEELAPQYSSFGDKVENFTEIVCVMEGSVHDTVVLSTESEFASAQKVSDIVVATDHESALVSEDSGISTHLMNFETSSSSLVQSELALHHTDYIESERIDSAVPETFSTSGAMEISENKPTVTSATLTENKVNLGTEQTPQISSAVDQGVVSEALIKNLTLGSNVSAVETSSEIEVQPHSGITLISQSVTGPTTFEVSSNGDTSKSEFAEISSITASIVPTSTTNSYTQQSIGGYFQPVQVSLDEMSFSIPNEMVGVVIGRGGENIQKIQRDFGISIQIAKTQDLAPGATSRQVVLKGPRSTLTYAKLEVDKLISGAKSGFPIHPNSSVLQQTSVDSISMVVPNDKVGLVIGKQGGTIKGIQLRTQAHIQIPAEADADDPTRRTITISAPTKMQVDIAMREIQNVIDVGSGVTSGSNTVILQVPNDRVGLIIGKSGVTIKDLQNRTGARIQIPPSPDPGTNVRSMTITGVGDSPIRAKYEMEQILAGVNGQYQRPQTNYGVAPVFGATQFTQQHPQQAYGIGMYSQPAYPQTQSYVMPPSQGLPGYVQQFQQPTLSDAYAQHFQQRPVQAVQAQAPAPRIASSVDLTQYYPQFWQYAAYYGERVAREQYGAWAPPIGTAPPPGVILPLPGQEQPAPTTAPR